MQAWQRTHSSSPHANWARCDRAQASEYLSRTIEYVREMEAQVAPGVAEWSELRMARLILARLLQKARE